MWAYETTFYQIYTLGQCGCPRENAPVGEESKPPADAPLFRLDSWPYWIQHYEGLRVGALLLNPIFESDSHGYDTRDFRMIDRRLGTNESFRALVAALHSRSIRVVIDAVFNHVGRNFWAFRDVREHRWESPYRDWFNISFDGDSCYGDGFWYEGWEGHYELVKLNLRNPAVVEYLLDTVRFWVDEFDIDGLRLDVAYSLDRDFMRRLRALADGLSAERGEGRELVLIGECLHGDYNQIVNDEMLHSCTNYECYKGLYSSFNSQNMFEIAHSLHRQFGPDPWCIYQGKHLLSFADNHDVTRLASILTDPACVRPAYGVLFGMPGIPCIYYGSEWGAEGVKGANDDYDLRPRFAKPVENDLYQFVRKLGWRRYERDENGGMAAMACALNYGGYRNVVITNKQLLFERATGDACVYVAVNAVNEPFTLAAGELSGTFWDYNSDGPRELVELDGTFELEPYGVHYLLRA